MTRTVIDITQDGKLIASRAEGYYAKKNTDIQQTEEVIVDPERFYRFTVFDRKGDGFQGQITVVRGKQNVKSDALVWEPGKNSRRRRAPCLLVRFRFCMEL